MSGTAAAEPAPGGAEPAPVRSRWKGRCCLVLVLLVVLVAGYGARIAQKLPAPAPLPFEPFQWKPLEESLLAARFDVDDLRQKLLGGAADVSLDERDLNALVFGRGVEQTPGRKARLLIRSGHLRLESSSPRADGAGYWNVALDFTLSIGPNGLSDLQVQGGEIGEYGLDPFSRWLLVRAVRQGLAETLETEPRLRRIRALSVEGDRVHLTYDSQQ